MTKEVKAVEEKKVTTGKILKLAWNIFFWAVFACIAIMWVTDYLNVKDEKDPIFCISKNVIDKEDGYIDECVGVGYKTFKYHTKSNDGASEFGAFWITPRD